jgi:RNA polymerase sigma factor (sigma-70 family)
VALRKTDVSQFELRRSWREPAELLGLIKKGDIVAFQLFQSAANGLLFAILLNILGHSETAEEALADLYVEIRRKPIGVGRQNEPLTWLILVAHRHAIERLCRQINIQNAFPNGNSITHATNAESFINITEQRRLIRATLNSIPQSQRQMIELALISGMNIADIATRLGESCEVVDDGLRSGTRELFCMFSSLNLPPKQIAHDPRG